MRFQLYRSIKWLYQKFKLSVWVPFLALISYTLLGAFIFQSFERDRDQVRREIYRNRTVFALDQVLDRMLEVRCHDQLLKANRELQVHHAKQALYWFLDHLNLTEVIDERTDNTPWTWLGSMFYAGQLYTTIGYGYPTTRTTGGRVASIFYILIGIPIFLIILKDMGRILSRALRKLYKRLRTSKRKIVETTPIRRLSLPKMSLYKTSKAENGCSPEKSSGEDERKQGIIMQPEEQNKINNRLQSENSFPIPIALCILLLWIVFSASLFCIWEPDWGFMTSVYFFFVSISTVGLGDIVFSNPDMMLYNFLLILIGLTLLSMCFNLIQTALERLLDRLLEEYIEEIEKMAEIVANEDFMEEETVPLEFKMAGNLLALPMKKVTHDSSFLAEAKGWMAGRIANNLLASRLGPSFESDSEEEREEEKEQLGDLPSIKSRQMSKTSTMREGSPHPSPIINMNRYQFRHNRPMFNTIRTLEKIKKQPGDFRGMVFSKFIQSDRLTKLVEETSTPAKKMVTSSCQTEPEESEKVRRRKWRQLRKDSVSSFSTVYTNSMLLDDESLLSAAYCDIKFDYSTDASTPNSNIPSTQSILKLDDEEPILPSKLNSVWATNSSWRSPPMLRVQTNLPAVHELPSPIPSLLKVSSSPVMSSRHVTSSEAPPLHRYPSESNINEDEKSEEVTSNGVQSERMHAICGLLPNDFDSTSTSSRSTMLDSGYDRSQQDTDIRKKMMEESINEDYEEIV